MSAKHLEALKFLCVLEKYLHLFSAILPFSATIFCYLQRKYMWGRNSANLRRRVLERGMHRAVEVITVQRERSLPPRLLMRRLLPLLGWRSAHFSASWESISLSLRNSGEIEREWTCNHWKPAAMWGRERGRHVLASVQISAVLLLCLFVVEEEKKTTSKENTAREENGEEGSVCQMKIQSVWRCRENHERRALEKKGKWLWPILFYLSERNKQTTRGAGVGETNMACISLKAWKKSQRRKERKPGRWAADSSMKNCEDGRRKLFTNPSVKKPEEREEKGSLY